MHKRKDILNNNSTQQTLEFKQKSQFTNLNTFFPLNIDLKFNIRHALRFLGSLLSASLKNWMRISVCLWWIYEKLQLQAHFRVTFWWLDLYILIVVASLSLQLWQTCWWPMVYIFFGKLYFFLRNESKWHHGVKV